MSHCYEDTVGVTRNLTIRINETDVLDVAPWLSNEQVGVVLTQLVTTYSIENGISRATISDTVTNLGLDNKYALLCRASHVDTWSQRNLATVKDLNDECLHLLHNGWQVDLPEFTISLLQEQPYG